VTDLFGGTNVNEPFDAEYLRSILHYDPETGDWRWLVRLSNDVKIGQPAGYTHARGYKRITIHKRTYNAAPLAWLYKESSRDLKSIMRIEIHQTINGRIFDKLHMLNNKQ
jgi:hypothetical protein